MLRVLHTLVGALTLGFACSGSDDSGQASAGPGGDPELAVVSGGFSYYDQQYGCDDVVTFTGVQVGGLRHTLTADITLSHQDGDEDRCASAPWTDAMSGRLEVRGVEVTYEGRWIGDVTGVGYDPSGYDGGRGALGLRVSDLQRSVSVGSISFHPVGRYEL